MIDPRLKTLRVLARCGTVGATAELTGYSPSAVSAQLRELQRVLGMQLLTKDGRGVRLTATGRFLVAGSDAVIAEWERLRAAALEAGGQTQSRFGLGGFSSAAAQLPEVRFVKVDSDAAPAVSAKYGIRSIPTLVLFDGGREKDRVSGVMSAKDLLAWLGQRTPRKVG